MTGRFHIPRTSVNDGVAAHIWVGGVLSAMILTLFVIPSGHAMWQWWKERSEFSEQESQR